MEKIDSSKLPLRTIVSACSSAERLTNDPDIDFARPRTISNLNAWNCQNLLSDLLFHQ